MTALPNFDLGFWHPFGDHYGEATQSILPRKHREAEANDWTLWSFKKCQFEQWLPHLAAARKPIVVLCSDSPGAKDPGVGKQLHERQAREYREAGAEDWRPVPTGVEVPHGFGPAGRVASAFVVERVIEWPLDLPRVSWWHKGSRSWKDESLPTRSEHLIRVGGGAALRPVRAALVLRRPYLVHIRP